MRAIKFLGICIPVINVMYSAVYMGLAGSDLYTVADKMKTTSSILWIVGYFLYIVLNLTVFMRILAKDIVDYVLYICCSGALFIARVFHLTYINVNGKLEVYYLATDAFILLSMVIMLVVFIKMDKSTSESESAAPKEVYSQARTEEPTNRTQPHQCNAADTRNPTQMEQIPLNNTQVAAHANSNVVVNNQTQTTFCCWYDTGPSYYGHGYGSSCCSGGGGGGGEAVGDAGGGGCCSDGCCGDDDGCCAGNDGGGDCCAGDESGCCNDDGCEGCCEGGDGGCEGGDGGCDGCGDGGCDGCGDADCGDADCGDADCDA